MDWIVVSLVSAAASGVLSIIDKKTLTRYMPSVKSFGLLLGFVSAVWGAVALAAAPPGPGVSTSVLVIAVLSGSFWGAGLLVYFRVLRVEEVSRTSPVFHTYPALVAILGVSFLGESLSSLQWLAVMVTVVGAVLISSRSSPGRIFAVNRSTFAPLMLASSFAAVGQITSKYALENAPFWTVFGLRNIGTALPFLVFLSKESFKGIYLALKYPVGRYVIIGGEVFYASFTVWLSLVAVSMRPVSIVSALIGTRPVFIFFYSIVLSSTRIRLMDEPLNRRIILSKAVAITLVVVGVGVISIL